MIDLETAGAVEIASYFSHEVNSLLFRPDGIAGEQKGSKQMKDLDICWIKMLSGDSYGTDRRNEASAERGKQLAGIPFVKEQIGAVSNGKMEAVARIMATDHRTLQQAFSGLVFLHFLQSCNRRDSRTLLVAMGESFYKLPLI